MANARIVTEFFFNVFRIDFKQIYLVFIVQAFKHL
jgi:hypothetical protein